MCDVCVRRLFINKERMTINRQIAGTRKCLWYFRGKSSILKVEFTFTHKYEENFSNAALSCVPIITSRNTSPKPEFHTLFSKHCCGCV